MHLKKYNTAIKEVDACVSNEELFIEISQNNSNSISKLYLSTIFGAE